MSKRKGPPFVALTRDTLKSLEWRQGLSLSEKEVYLQLKRKYVGHNNGDIELHYSELPYLSPTTVCKAFKGLEAKGWIKRTRHGGLYRFTNKFRLTWNHDGWHE